MNAPATEKKRNSINHTKIAINKNPKPRFKFKWKLLNSVLIKREREGKEAMKEKVSSEAEGMEVSQQRTLSIHYIFLLKEILLKTSHLMSWSSNNQILENNQCMRKAKEYVGLIFNQYKIGEEIHHIQSSCYNIWYQFFLWQLQYKVDPKVQHAVLFPPD